MDEQELEERLRRNQLWAQELLSGAFGTAEADVEALLATAQAELGPHRQERCVTVVAAGQLSARPWRLGAIAELVVATGTIGVRWWSERLVRWTPSPAPIDHTPDEILDGAATPPGWVEPSGGVLQWLANEAAEAVAVLEWGPPAGWADLNDPRLVDQVDPPAGARPGDRLSLVYDPGARVDAVVVEHGEGHLGTRIDLDSARYVHPCDVAWAWAMRVRTNNCRLPGETARDDPYTQPVAAPSVAEGLRRWALERGVSGKALEASWQTVGDVASALDQAGNEPINVASGWGLSWQLAVTALLDGDNATAAEGLRHLSDAPSP